MSMEWFNRVTGELQDHLKSICEEYDQIGHMNINRGSKHPRIEFLSRQKMTTGFTFAPSSLIRIMKNFT